MVRTVCNLDDCAGCMACVDICPKNAIKIEDSLREYNAVIDENRCIQCNVCHCICPQNNPPIAQKPLYWKEGWAKNKNIRVSSSSGGVAVAIELAFIKQGGCVCSCLFSDGKFTFSFADKEEDVRKFSGSKYVKSSPQGIYKEILKRLKVGKNVLFVGLPCQVAGLKNYVGMKENLYTIDLICHGSPSPKVLEMFLADYKCKLKDLQDLSFRKKMNFRLEENSKEFTVPTVMDFYTRTFLKGTSYTNNCYQCKFAKLERVSDITLGDSWGSQLLEKIQREGVSLLLCQSEKGWKLLNEAELDLFEVDLEGAIKCNHQLESPSARPAERDLFFDEIEVGNSFKRAFRKCYQKEYIKANIKTFFIKMGLLRG